MGLSLSARVRVSCDAVVWIAQGFLCEEMVPHHVSPAVTVSKRGYSLPTLPKSSTGYVGLKNLGCICYMCVA